MTPHLITPTCCSDHQAERLAQLHRARPTPALVRRLHLVREVAR